MRRVLLLLALLTPFTATAQRIYRIAVIEREPALVVDPNVQSLLQGFKELGYREHKDFSLYYESADGRDARYPALCKEVVKRKVDLIVTRGTAATQACKRATSSIPILFAGVADPVSDGLVADIGHPGGNVTGIMYASGPLVTAARVELLRELFPQIAMIGVIANLGGQELPRQRQQAESAARQAGIGWRLFDVRSVADLQTAFAQAANDRVEAMYVALDSLTESNRRLVGSLGLKHRLPVLAGETAFVEAGSLISYGADTPGQYKRVAAIADRIFRGANPADIPVERPTVFSLAVNLKTANALGVRVPPSLLSRAERVIQ